VNKIAFAVTLALAFASQAQARLVEIAPQHDYAESMNLPWHSGRIAAADVFAAQTREVVAAPARMSELPEPEVFAMMLLGLCLIGYRASRDSSEKFK
jgi:purine-nucleoside phosphorylase